MTRRVSFLRAVAAALLALLLCASFCACGSDAQDAALAFLLPEVPTTLDPQLASSDSERLLVRNLFEGLMRADETGKIVTGCAERYKKDGLTYRFYLSPDAVWSNGDALIADDFVFAFRRALSPETKAPAANTLYCIAGAESFATGRANAAALQVRAADRTTVEITLAREDSEFLTTLTTAVCMPCQRAFFEKANGKYGLDQENVLANGSYRLRLWDPPGAPSFAIRLTRNTKYNGKFPSRNASVRFTVPAEDEDALTRVTEGYADGAAVSGIAAAVPPESLNATLYSDVAWVLALPEGMPDALRQSLCLSIDASRYAGLLPEGAAPADHLLPPDLRPSGALDGRSTHVDAYQPAQARALFSQAITSLPNARLPETTLLYYNTPLLRDVATALAAHWQQNLGAYLNIKPADSLSALVPGANGGYQLALLPVTGGADRFAAPAFFERCLRCTGRTDEAATSALAALRSVSPAAAGDAIDRLQSVLLSDRTLVPIFYSRTVLAFDNAISTGATSRSDGWLDFAFVTKLDF